MCVDTGGGGVQEEPRLENKTRITPVIIFVEAMMSSRVLYWYIAEKGSRRSETFFLRRNMYAERPQHAPPQIQQ